MRRTLVMFMAVLLALTVAAPTLAANAHFIKTSASGPNAAGDLKVNFKLAGLGANETITIEASADATAVSACRNNGGGFPNDPKKTSSSGRVTASGDFTSGKNGSISSSLTLSPPATSLTCPPGQKVVLVSVSYTNVQVSGGGDTENISGTFAKTYFTI